MSQASSARYRFGDSGRTGLVLGLSMRQSLPLIAGVVWLTLWLMAQLPLVGIIGLLLGLVVSFGRWRHSPLYEIAAPGAALGWRTWRRRGTWVRRSLLAAGPGAEHELPPVMEGLELFAADVEWHGRSKQIAVVRDRRAATVSLVLPVRGDGFPVASPSEQDALVAGWGAALAPLARARSVVSRVTWQEWTRPAGVGEHLAFVAGLNRQCTSASDDYDDLLALQAPITIAHDTLVTVTVDLKRVKARRHRGLVASAVDALVEEAELLVGRLETTGLSAGVPMSPIELPPSIRLRSDPRRVTSNTSPRVSLAAAAGRGLVEWGPMAVRADWSSVRVDGSYHRAYRVASWPMLPVAADWLGPLLTAAATRTVTVVMEPVPLAKAAAEANRQLTSIETDQSQKERHGFRLTARERRRQSDVENRERELAEGHPEFRHVAIVTVTASSVEELDDASARVEQAAAQSLLDLRVLAARQAEGWLASLPLGRSVLSGAWS